MIFDINVSIYELKNDSDIKYILIINLWKENSGQHNDILLILLSGNINFSKQIFWCNIMTFIIIYKFIF